MGQKQFEEFQDRVGLLSAEQLKRLQEKIESEIDNTKEPLINEEELELISSLFR